MTAFPDNSTPFSIDRVEATCKHNYCYFKELMSTADSWHHWTVWIYCICIYIYIYIYIYFLSKTVCDPTTQQVPVATGSGFNTLEQILSITTVPVEPPPKIQEYIHQRVQVFV